MSAHAEQRWFEVELLLFERNTDIQSFNEQLTSQDLSVDSSNSISILKTKKSAQCLQVENCLSQSNPTVITNSEFDYAGNNFKRLSNSHLELVAQRERLEKHAGFEPLLHMVWRMPVESGRTAKPIHIFAGNNLAKNIDIKPIKIKIDNNTADESTSNLVSDAEIDAAMLNEDIWEIDGNFKIYLDHYLYIDSQLIISKAITEEIPQAEQVIEMIDDENGIQIAKVTTEVGEATQSNVPNVSIRQTVIKEILFDQNRRLRSEEIHYLDHPLMGIIVQIRKIPKEEL